MLALGAGGDVEAHALSFLEGLEAVALNRGEVGEKIIKEFAGHTIPTVFIDYYSPIYACNYIFVDNYQMSYMLTKYLIQKGHRNIGFIGDISSTNSIADRYFGYLKALKEEKLVVNPLWHINENIERPAFAQRLESFFINNGVSSF